MMGADEGNSGSPPVVQTNTQPSSVSSPRIHEEVVSGSETENLTSDPPSMATDTHLKSAVTPYINLGVSSSH